jgi:hypothetical protein
MNDQELDYFLIWVALLLLILSVPMVATGITLMQLADHGIIDGERWQAMLGELGSILMVVSGGILCGLGVWRNRRRERIR